MTFQLHVTSPRTFTENVIAIKSIKWLQCCQYSAQTAASPTISMIQKVEANWH